MTTVDNPKLSPLTGKDEDQKETGFFNRPQVGGKSLWDWLQLLAALAVPLILGLATLLLSTQQTLLAQQQHDADQQRATNQQQAAILQTYIDNIQDLLLNHNLLGESPNPNNASARATIYEVQELARARTVTALQGLDTPRKVILVLFLYNASLIGFWDGIGQLHAPIISLSGANLSGADLSGALLSGANFSFVNLDDATLSHANINNADLSQATLDGANLTNINLRSATLDGAILTHANLSQADLFQANLTLADLSGANLTGALDLTQQQLDVVSSCKNAILPRGLACHPKKPIG